MRLSYRRGGCPHSPRRYAPRLAPGATDIVLNTQESAALSSQDIFGKDKRALRGGASWRPGHSVAADFSLSAYCSELYLEPERGTHRTKTATGVPGHAMALLLGGKAVPPNPYRAMWHCASPCDKREVYE